MNFLSVIDTSAFIWDVERFEMNAAPFYELGGQLMKFIEILEKEKPLILMRTELNEAMINSFPSNKLDGIPNFRDLSRVVYSFLADISEDIVTLKSMSSTETFSEPNIAYDYFSPDVKEEISYLVHKMHTGTDEYVFFTFQYIWSNQDVQLVTFKSKNDKKPHETVIYSSESIDKFFLKHKPIFEHNSKHDRNKGYRIENGEEIFPLSCFDGKDMSIPQQLLANAIRYKKDKKKLYSYDVQNKTFVCFTPHSKNRYHGFDQPDGKVPPSINAQKARFLE
jgi:hypothetical protein